MVFWNWFKREDENQKRVEQAYVLDLEQKNQLIMQYMENEQKYKKDQTNHKQMIQELQNKIVEFEKREIEYQNKLKKLQEGMKSVLKKTTSQEPVAEGHFKIMDRLSKKTINGKTVANPQPFSETMRSFHPNQQAVQTMGNYYPKQQFTPISKNQPSLQQQTTQPTRKYYPGQTSAQTVEFNPFKRNRPQ